MNRGWIAAFPLAALLALTPAGRAADFTADSARGAQLFETLACVQCHSINGKGGAIAPDLGRMVDRSFTPATLASTLWNHAPKMWASMRERDIRAGDLNESAAADLFAYFYAARFFEKPGDAGRGVRLFASEHCADCHGITQAKIPEAKPVAQWEGVGDPIALIDAMWNHGATMREEFAKRKLKWPTLQPQDLTDILVYLRSLPATRGTAERVQITSGAKGAALFETKGCAGCHRLSLGLDARLKHMTLTEIAAAMWNHHPKMTATPQRLDLEEMGELISYLWARQFFEDAGSAAAGRRVFTGKRCAGCHENGSSGAPKLPDTGRAFTGATMVSALWHHGPRMLEQMRSESIPWPRFDAQEMSNLIAYLNIASLNSAKGGSH